MAPRAGNKAPLVLVDEWLGRPIPQTDPYIARAELLRRYLRRYGPSTRGDFAAWVGVQAGDADHWWRLIENELTQVGFGRGSWILTEDLNALRAATPPKGVRLLPQRDPYTQMRDRETIVDEKHVRSVWKPVGEPGTVLADSEIVGIWRPHKSGRKLTVRVDTFRSVPDGAKKALRQEAEQVAELRGATSMDIVFGTL
ncbi:DNA glycosylase AlkZ-like family protein [Salininema proteolyticum]|uniref:DNA glycosylase AlkZ-like family protein n=1 Tax=Salininema proteolyticum TaxID=1607685 RepID=A0ABV8U3D9_9ACTN